jgi:hypothetical protein
MRGTLWALVPFILSPGAGRAQAPDALARGTIIRVSRVCPGPLPGASRQTGCPPERGVLVGSDSAGLTWRSGGSSVVRVTPWSQVGSVEVSRGKGGHAGTGAAAGAIVGAIPGALSGMAFAGLCECSHPNYAGGALIGGLIFAGPGALVGAIVGQLVRTERWGAVPVDRLRVTIIPEARRLGISLAVRF